MSKFSKFLTIIGLVSVLSMVSILSVSAANNTDCMALTGSTSGTAGADGGVYDFVVTDPADLNNKACIKTQEDLNEDRIFFDGYVWNDNLGWVSTKSIRENQTGISRFRDNDSNSDGIGDNAPYSNQGLPTGNYIYYSYLYLPGGFAAIDSIASFPGFTGTETTVDDGNYRDPVTSAYVPNPAAPQLFGYWWGQNLGYLRLNCREYADTGGHADADNYCNVSNHRVYVQSVVGGYAKLAGHAWSDAHGWVDFDGVQIPVNDLYQELHPKVTIKPVKYSGASWLEYEGPVVANAYPVTTPKKDETGYQVEVAFYDSEDFSGDPVPSKDVDFCFIWVDNRYLNYANTDVSDPDVGTPTDYEDCFAASNLGSRPYGPLDKFFNKTDDFYYDLGEDVHVTLNKGVLKSQVPALGSELYLSGIKVAGQVYDLGESHSLVFEPPYKYQLFQGELEGSCATYEPTEEERSLDLYLGINDPITFCGDFNAFGLGSSLNLAVDVDYNYTLNGDSIFDLIDHYFDSDDDDYIVCPLEGEVANYKPLDRVLDPGVAGPPAPARFVDTALMWMGIRSDSGECGANASLDAVNINSLLDTSELVATVSYNTSRGVAGRITRQTAKLEKAPLNVAQANIEGNVQSSAIQLFDDDVSYSSSGSTVRAETREAILKDFSELVKGSKGGCKVTSSSFEGNIKNCGISENLYLIDFRDAGDTRMSVRTSADLFWGIDDEIAAGSPGKTLVVIGSSIIVDDNLFFLRSSQYAEDAAYGLVALKDSEGRGGNVYIASGVTDIRGHIYADGSVYSVEMPEVVGKVGGLFNGAITDFGSTRDNFKNQLTIVGQLISKNTVGGGTSRSPRAGDGSILREGDRSKAKSEDLNFWRSSPMALDLRTDGFVHLCGQEDDPEFAGSLSIIPMLAGEDVVSESEVDVDAGLITWNAIQFALREELAGIEMENFFCWDLDKGRTSLYFDPAKGAEEAQPAYERYVLNILFEVAPKGLPLF